jgi:hypothetical protein
MTDKKSDGSTAGERVGYRNPPKSGQFVKGKSGNPNGRGRRPRTVAPTWADCEYEAMLVEEMDRPVSVREGEIVEKTSAGRAATRAMVWKAAKGDVKAYVAVSAKRDAIEDRRRAEREEIQRKISEYKAEMTYELGRRKAAGVIGPEIIPHPDDIEISPKTGFPVFNGPISINQKMAQDFIMSRGPAMERALRKLPGFISKDPRFLREHAKLRRESKIVGALVAKRASRINSWDISTPEERIDFLRTCIPPNTIEHCPPAVFQSDLFIKMAFSEWLGIEPTEAEREACALEVIEIFAAA